MDEEDESFIWPYYRYMLGGASIPANSVAFFLIYHFAGIRFLFAALYLVFVVVPLFFDQLEKDGR